MHKNKAPGDENNNEVDNVSTSFKQNDCRGKEIGNMKFKSLVTVLVKGSATNSCDCQ